ncbi:hypothetical protein D9758_003810 [Tetrapyrgos nigripes]|uniref:Calcofluor white hypersensitive protein n=1 Tax=Tetrapyrgos nigripes TaxID=182062 RepID=A0A8H5GLY6_9AGAR|nr:hypothetical protein D9758_003810 [Tetrapyrgos nigripes]
MVPTNLTIKASYVARVHTVLAYTAFTVALFLGLLLHYKKIVKNSVAGYPQEWFPSVSATIGDWYPERNIFQILIALTSGPRFALVALSYYQHYSAESFLPTAVFICGVLRTLSCGAWVYITSSDDHDVHDFFMILYIVLNLPWMVGGIFTTPVERKSVRRKRLFVVAFSSCLTVLSQAIEWRERPYYHSILTALGLLLSSVLKHANGSNNPIWPFVNEDSGGYNKTGLTLAFVSLIEYFCRQPSAQQSKEQIDREPSKHWFSGALPLGSLIFISHSLLSDSSILIAWSWTGFESGRPRGPLPNLHAPLTIVSQCLGLLLAIRSLNNPRPLSHPLWFAFGSLSCFVMYRWRNWLGYTGGLGFAFFMMSCFPVVLGHAAANGGLAKTSFNAFLVYCLLNLASVWTVAYAFVPGGIYLRERTDLVLIAQMLCLSLAFDWPSKFGHRNVTQALPASVSSFSRMALTCISVFALLASLYRLPPSPKPFRPGPRIIRTGIWTLHFGIDNAGRDSQRRVKNVIRDLELDVVGFLETDLYRTVFGNRDLTRVITEEMGYNVDIGPGPNSHTWGAVLLSKFPIINSTHHLLPSPHGELAPAIEAVLDVYGLPVTVVVAHNGQEEDPLDRELQSKELARIMASSYPNPVIFLGYVVSKPHAPRPAPYHLLIEDGKVWDVDEEDFDRWFPASSSSFYPLLTLIQQTVTDTELQVAQFLLPRHGFSVKNDTREARLLRAFKEELPPEHVSYNALLIEVELIQGNHLQWFPMEYYGNKREGGVNGHFYHVFNTERFFDCMFCDCYLNLDLWTGQIRAVLLVDSSAKGSSLVFRWPPHPVSPPRLRRAIPENVSFDNTWKSSQSLDASLLQQDISTRTTDYGTDPAYRWERPSATGSHDSSLTSPRSHPSSGRNSPSQDDFADSELKDDHDTIFGYSPEFLAGILCPHRSMCHQKFEFMVDDLVFIGHPVCAEADGTWRFRLDTNKASTRGRDSRNRYGAQVHDEDPAASRSPSNEKTGSQSQSAWLHTFHFVMVLDLPDPSSSASGNVSKYFDIIYEQIAFTMAAVLFQEQVQSNFVESECDRLGSLKDDCIRKGSSFLEFSTKALQVSSIAPAMKTLFEAIKTKSIAYISIHDLPLELQLPPYLDLLLHSEEDQDYDLFNAGEEDEAEIWGPEMSFGWRLPSLAPWKSLLMLDDDEEDSFSNLRNSHVASDDRILIDGLIKFLDTVSVTLSLADVASLLDWDLETQIYPTARWLVLHRKAKIIDVIHDGLKTVFTLPPTFSQPISQLAADFERAFTHPAIPPLPQILSTISTSSSKQSGNHFYASVVQSKELVPLYHDIVLWMLKRDMLITLHLRIRVVATVELKYRVRIRRERDRGRQKLRSDMDDSEIDWEAGKHTQRVPSNDSGHSRLSELVIQEDGDDEGRHQGQDEAEMSDEKELYESGAEDEFVPSMINDPGRATPLQRRWLAAMSEGKEEYITRRFDL